jgi:hypothetical protein
MKDLAELLAVAPMRPAFTDADGCQLLYRPHPTLDVVHCYSQALGLEQLEIAALGFKRFLPNATANDFRQFLERQFA